MSIPIPARSDPAVAPDAEVFQRDGELIYFESVQWPESELVRYTRREWRRRCYLESLWARRVRRREAHPRRVVRALLHAAHTAVACWAGSKVLKLAREACGINGLGIASFPTRVNGLDVVVTPNGVFLLGRTYEEKRS